MDTAKNVIMTPIQVGPCTFKNRIMMAAMESRLSTPLGDTTQEMCDYYAERAKGGAAAIVVENTFVDDIASRSSLASSGLSNDQLIAGKYRLAEAIKKNGALAILQLSHGGLQANPAAVPGQEAVAPSAVASKAVGRMPRALEHDEIVAIEDAFAEAARRAQQAGFDGVEIHGAHGYLICEFLSQYTNKRTDEYGGSRENRARFALNILKKVRAKVGDKFLVGFRISGEEKVDGGMTIEDSCAFGRMFEDYVDYIHVSVGNYETMATWLISPMYRPEHAIVDLASAMKKAVTKCKVVTVNALTAESAEQALENDDADLVAFARPLLADPYMPQKIKEGRLEDIRPCMRGHEGCVSLFFRGCPIRCEVNPQAGQEREYHIVPVNDKDKKKIIVAGGGMAGMETARVARLYGHDVTLVERSDRLGGHFMEASEPKFKSGARGDLLWLERQVKKADIRIMMNTEVTAELLASLDPDAVVLAVGSDYMVPPIPGIENTITADKALLEKGSVKGKTVIIGGGLVGSETALGLAKEGMNVTILEMLPDIVMQDEPISQTAIKGELAAADAKIITSAKVTKIHPDSVEYEREGREEKVPADTIIAALGLKARKGIVDELKDVCPETYVIGDAVRGRKLYNCMHEAWDTVRKISGVF
jgi:2,4-dienoyl-CoA reductase-like NADH-dependent reductase (Old Yellow Enzyme family)/thioredoxin reductase